MDFVFIVCAIQKSHILANVNKASYAVANSNVMLLNNSVLYNSNWIEKIEGDNNNNNRYNNSKN